MAFGKPHASTNLAYPFKASVSLPVKRGFSYAQKSSLREWKECSCLGLQIQKASLVPVLNKEEKETE